MWKGHRRTCSHGLFPAQVRRTQFDSAQEWGRREINQDENVTALFFRLAGRPFKVLPS
jgi:hypothetical protein